MNARELIAELRMCGPQSLSVFLHFIADRAYEARLADGKRITDVIDAAAWLRELAEADKVVLLPESLKETSPSLKETFSRDQRRWNDFCPDCGHAHRGDSECEEPTGAGRTCRCERKVTA